MKKIFLFFLLLFSFVTPAFSSTKINVIKVYDGDTILAQIEDNIFRIRLINIDCFEGTKSDRAKWQARKYKISLDELIEGGNIAGDILAQKLKILPFTHLTISCFVHFIHKSAKISLPASH